MEGSAGPSLAPRLERKVERLAEFLVKRTGGAATHVIYGVNVATSYLLMLAAMTFNIGVFATICVGMAFGHYFFRGFTEEATEASQGLADACCADHV